MKRAIITTLVVLATPTAVLAAPEPEFYRFIEQHYRMFRDGSIEDAIEEGKENVRAFERLQNEKRRLQEENRRRQDEPRTAPAQLKRQH